MVLSNLEAEILMLNGARHGTNARHSTSFITRALETQGAGTEGKRCQNGRGVLVA